MPIFCAGLKLLHTLVLGVSIHDISLTAGLPLCCQLITTRQDYLRKLWPKVPLKVCLSKEY